MIGRCHTCGVAEHIHLLDAKNPNDNESGDWTLIQCIACYGEGWCPTGGRDDVKLSVAPALKPFYDTFFRRAA